MVSHLLETDNLSGLPSNDSDSDAALVLASRHDLKAFEALYRRYVDRVYRYCLRRMDDPERAADATSAIFIKAMQSIDHCQPESFRSWLFSIAHNTTIDVARVNRLHVRIDDDIELADRAPDPEHATLTAETRLEVVALLAYLTPEQRQVVELRLAGLDGYEIAQTLGRSRASIDTAQSRAVARLRRVLGVRRPNEQTEERHAASQ